MPSRRQPLLDMTQPQGVNVTGPETGPSSQFLRRARGVHEICEHEYRLAPTDTQLYAQAGIHSIVRFLGVRIYAAGVTLYAAGAAFFTNLTNRYLTLQRLPPGNTQQDRLFWCGGGYTRKADAASAVTNWGIDPPADGLAVALASQLTKTVENFEAFGDWTIVGAGVTAANEGTIKQDGNSLKVVVPTLTLTTLRKASALDLSIFAGAGDSSNEDFIELWVRVDGETGTLDYITLRFDVGGGGFGSDYYQYKFLPTSVTVNTHVLGGTGTDPQVSADESAFIQNQGGTEDSGGSSSSPSGADSGQGPGGTGDDFSDGSSDGISMSSATWTRLRVAKASFGRSGNNTNTWANVAAIQLMIQTTAQGGCTCYFDFCRMRGGAGMLGDYKSLVTFDNTTTGARSNSNPTPVLTNQNDRQKLSYTAIPVSADPQVNARTLWRTMGGGSRFFREHVIPNNADATYTSAVADFVGLWTNTNSAILYLPELPTDNARPEDAMIDFIYDQATIMWLSGTALKTGRLYFSPAGRPEAQRGFIQVTSEDQPLLRIIVWNRARYVIGTAGWYRIDGTEPYTAYHFPNVPGVEANQSRTIVPTPYGIIWNAKDGLRVFDGSTSKLLYMERTANVFRGEAAENLVAFLGVYAAFARDQYFISDGTQTFAFNLATGFIRDLGKGYTSLYYEDDTRSLLGGDSVGLVIVEGATLGGGTRAFDIRTAAYLFPDNTVGYVDQVFIDTNLAVATPAVILDSTTVGLPALAPAGTRRLLERQVGYPCRAVSLSLVGTDTTGHSLYGAECAVRDCTLELLTPQGIVSLMGRSSDLTSSIFFQVLEDQRQTEPIDANLMAYRFTIDGALNGATVTPTLNFVEGSVILPGMTGTTRAILQSLPLALGHLVSVSLAGNFMTPITLFRVELELRPCTMELTTPQGVLKVIGRSANTATNIYFEIPEQLRVAEPFDTNLLTYSMLIDINPAGNVITPALVFVEGTRTLANITGGVRAMQRLIPRQLGHLLVLSLTGNLFAAQLFRVELELRPVTCEVLTSQGAIKLIGRSNDATVNIFFELTEQQRVTEPFDTDILTYSLLIDHDGGAVTPSLVYTEGTVNPGAITTAPRAIKRSILRQMGHFISLTLTGNFFTTLTFYRVELELRPVTCEVASSQGDIKLIGRSNDVSVNIFFELTEQQRLVEPFDVDLLTYNMLFDHANGTITPSLAYVEGTITPAAVTSTTRAIHRAALRQMGHFLSLTAAGNFFSAITFYRAELELRPVTCELLTPQGQLKLTGRSTDVSVAILFEVTEQMRTAEPFDFNLDLYYLLLDAAGGTITPTVNCTEGTLSPTPIAFGARSLSRTTMRQLAHLLNITLSGNFFSVITLYRTEMELRPVTCELLTPQGIVKLMARSVDTTISILFEILEQQRTTEPFDQNLDLYYFLLDAQGGTIAPTLNCVEGAIVVPAASFTPRALSRTPLRKLAHLLNVTLAGNFFAGIILFRTELEMRPCTCEIVGSQGTTKLIGRSTDTSVSVLFEITEQQRITEPFDTDLQLTYILLDAAGGTISPALHCVEGTIAVPAATFGARSLSRTTQRQLAHLLDVTLTGDFFNTISLFRTEVEIRPVTLECLLPTGPIKLIGRSNDTSQNIFFELTPQQRTSEPFDNLMQLNRLTTEAIFNGASISPTVETDEENLTPPAMTGGSTHALANSLMIRQGHLVSVTYAGNFFSSIIWLKSELELRPLTCELVAPNSNFEQFNDAVRLQGRSVNLAAGLSFEVLEAMRYVEPMERLLQTERMTLDADLDGQVITPIINYMDRDKALPSFSGPGRTMYLDTPRSLGHIIGVTLQGDFTQPVLIRRVEVEIRVVYLMVMLEDRPQAEKVPARMLAPAQGLYFEIPEQLFVGLGSTQMVILKRLVLDIDLGAQSLTPTVITDLGSYIQPPLTGPGRLYKEWALGLHGRPKQIVLSSNLANITTLYSVELHCYVPDQRR